MAGSDKLHNWQIITNNAAAHLRKLWEWRKKKSCKKEVRVYKWNKEKGRRQPCLPSWNYVPTISLSTNKLTVD